MKRIAIIAVVVLTGAIAPVTRAQYSADYQTNIISGVVSNWAGDYVIGSNSVYDALVIDTGGILSNGFGYVGFESNASSNSAVVTGSGSIWTNQNNLNVGFGGSASQLVITNSGAVYCYWGYLGSQSSDNVAVITGTGSTWVIEREFFVGSTGSCNQVNVKQGGSVLNSHIGVVGYANTSSNNQVVISDPGSVMTYAFAWEIGYRGSGNSTIISNGGSVYSQFGYIGADVGQSNTAVICGPNSVWSIGNTLYVGYFGSYNGLVITNGGMISGGDNYIGFDVTTNNAVIVTGTGSVWNCAAGVTVGRYGFQSSLIIDGGGQVNDDSGYISPTVFGHSNSVVVTGSGSVWSNQSLLRIGANFGTVNGEGTLLITNGGVVVTSTFSLTRGTVTLAGGTLTVDQLLANASVIFASGTYNSKGTVMNNGAAFVVGDGVSPATFQAQGGSHSFPNGLQITSNAVLNGAASVFVTNSSGNALMEIRRGGSVTVSGMALTVDRLMVTNGLGSQLTFSGGAINTKATSITNGLLFSFGNGTDAATLQLLGGVHSFADNVRILSNALLSGCGTINGDVVVDPGGTVLADCGGKMTFTGIVTNNGLMKAINGSQLESYGTVVNNGLIDVIGGSANFHGTFINNGVLIDLDSAQITGISKTGSSVNVKVQSYVGHNFLLERRNVLNTGTWGNAPIPPQSGTGGILTFTDTATSSTTQRFYRVRIIH